MPRDIYDLPGQGRVRNATAEHRENARRLRSDMTPAEKRLWDALRFKQAGGLRFRRQHPVGTFVLDFYCPAMRLCLEIDGEIHSSPEIAEHDQLRQQAIEAFGVTVLRFSNKAIENNLPTVLEEIRFTADKIRSQNKPESH